MTVRPNEPWGDTQALPAGALIAADDRALAAAIEDAWRHGCALPIAALTGGDLRRALGGRRRASDFLEGPSTRARVDVGELRIGERSIAFVAHVIARSFGWGRVVAVMNSEFRGDWVLAPRAHPGDGELDVIEARLPLGDRLKARRRAPSGTHLPHPAITQRRFKGGRIELDRSLRVVADGRFVGRSDRLELIVHPAALVVHV